MSGENVPLLLEDFSLIRFLIRPKAETSIFDTLFYSVQIGENMFMMTPLIPPFPHSRFPIFIVVV